MLQARQQARAWRGHDYMGWGGRPPVSGLPQQVAVYLNLIDGVQSGRKEGGTPGLQLALPDAASQEHMRSVGLDCSGMCKLPALLVCGVFEPSGKIVPARIRLSSC